MEGVSIVSTSFLFEHWNDKVRATFFVINSQESFCNREMELMSQLTEKCEKEMVPLEEMVRYQLFYFDLNIRGDYCF